MSQYCCYCLTPIKQNRPEHDKDTICDECTCKLVLGVEEVRVPIQKKPKKVSKKIKPIDMVKQKEFGR
jgi:hypothetical protein